jgi:type VI secretion system protein ImpF
MMRQQIGNNSLFSVCSFLEFKMNSDQLFPFGFRPTLFDRLIPQTDELHGLSLQELRESIATDLEDLLNNRMIRLSQDLEDFPLAKSSIAQFGIIDFVGLSTANPKDRDKICLSIEESIAAHEPRLRNIQVEMLMDRNNVGSLCLSIQAYLNVHPLCEPIVFDALLNAVTQQYVISAKG